MSYIVHTISYEVTQQPITLSPDDATARVNIVMDQLENVFIYHVVNTVFSPSGNVSQQSEQRNFEHIVC